MRQLNIATTRLATLLVLHAAGMSFASPSVLVTRPTNTAPVEWLPRDNQSIYTFEEGEIKKLQLNTSSITDTPVFITVSPCTRDVHFAIYRTKAELSDGHASLVDEYRGSDVHTFSTIISSSDKYVLQLSSRDGGAAAISVLGERAKSTRLRLRVRSRKRLATNWDPSPIDPQATSYCVVASQKRNYTSLCAAQHDMKMNRLENKSIRFVSEIDRLNQIEQLDKSENQSEVDNKIYINSDSLGADDLAFRTIYRRKKISRSTTVTEHDPVITCVGGRTHHLIENLDPSTTYYVSVFGIGRDRRAGVLLATGSVRPRTSVAKRLRENVPYKTDIKTKVTFYFKATMSSSGGIWLAISTCGGSVDVEVSVRGKRLYVARNIDPHQNIYIPAPITSSAQETSDEGSVQFDSSSSEETRIRYVIKVVPSRRDIRYNGMSLQITASTRNWGIHLPESAPGDGAAVRELRPHRSCRSVDIAFLPASHPATDVIRYCISARENVNNDNHYITCRSTKKAMLRMQCVNHSQRLSPKVIVQKIVGLKPGKKYAVQVIASSQGQEVPYKLLHVDTNFSCRNDT